MCFGISFGMWLWLVTAWQKCHHTEVVRVHFLKTSDCGIPQKRKRMFLAAIRIDSINPAIGNVDNVWPVPLQREAGLMLP